MSKESEYKWLIVVEGNTDVKIYYKLFIYAAFSHGFEVSREKPTLPNEPNVIQNIKIAIGAN